MNIKEATQELAGSLYGRTVAAKFPAESQPYMVDYAYARLQLRRRLLAGELEPDEISRIAYREYRQAVASLERELSTTGGCEIDGVVYYSLAGPSFPSRAILSHEASISAAYLVSGARG